MSHKKKSMSYKKYLRKIIGLMKNYVVVKVLSTKGKLTIIIEK